MKRLPLVILVFAVLAAVVAGCGRAPHYDARLESADSLMRDCPDSSLSIVEGLCRDSLATEGDRAYHDLLLTQARYRCYVTATSDSDINRALAYYRAHPKEREKLTRANIYKGAVMDELGFPDSAMRYYKQAEAVADPTDYFNLGYIKMRMGTLYRDHYSMDGNETEKYEQALNCFQQTDNKPYQLKCLINLGCLYRIKFPHRADSTFHEAMKLAIDLGDTSNLSIAATDLAQLYYHNKLHSKARGIIHYLMKMGMERYPVNFYPTAASVYACLGMVDSAELFLQRGQSVYQINDILDKMTYMESAGMIALARGDKRSHELIASRCRHLADSLHSLKGTLKIIQAETSFDKMSLDENRHISDVLKRTLIALTLLVTLIILSILLLHRRRKHRMATLLSELEQESETQLIKLNNLQRTIERHNNLNSNVKEFFNSQILMMQQVADECYHSPNNTLAKSIKNLVKYDSNNSAQWLPLLDWVDSEYGHIIKISKENHPQLNDKELLMIALTALDFSCAQIAIFFGFDQATSAGAARTRIARKMNLNTTLTKYIEQFK